MSAIYDHISDTLLPTFVASKYPSPFALSCACDMCYDPTFGQIRGIGPHDLHCVCDPCTKFSLDEDLYETCMYNRYPQLYPDPLNPPPPQIHQIHYESPLTSPTNQEMHAYNGNLAHQHHPGWGDFVRAAGRGLSGSANSADRFAAGSLGSSALLGSLMAYTGTQNMAKPLAELREQLFPTHVHDPNSWNEANKVKPPQDHAPMKSVPKIKNELKKEKVTPILKRSDYGDDYEFGIDPFDKDMEFGGDSYYQQQNQLLRADMQPITTAPTNKEMHALNGNIMGPQNKGVSKKLHLNQMRRLKRKINKTRKAEKGLSKNIKSKLTTVKQMLKATVAKANTQSKWQKKAAQNERKDVVLARRYANFLKHPIYRPPRIGSTGTIQTKLLHGYYETTVNAASTHGLTNVTDIVAFLNPKMFSYSTSSTNFAAPLTIGYAVNSFTPFTNVAGSNLAVYDWANVTQLKNEVGVSVSTDSVPAARWLGGHVSIRCRCPIGTTASPFLYGGLLGSDPIPSTSGSPTGDPATQINQLTNDQIRIMPCSDEIDGMEGSVVYVPATQTDLQFNSMCCNFANATFPASPVPYIGMTAIPSAAVVSIIASGWWEIMPTKNNMAYGGWAKGPKISAEDVFDNLPNINPVNARSQNLGTRNNAGVTVGALLKDKPKDPVQELDQLKIQFDDLKHRFQQLTVNIEPDTDEDDEKYSVPNNSPVYHGLTKSTIDLALQLKDKLTPGSVTSKTSRSTLP